MEFAKVKSKERCGEHATEQSRGRSSTSTAGINLHSPFLQSATPAVRLTSTSPFTGSPARGTLQRKLTVGQPGDEYEQEADRIAEQVMRMPYAGISLQRKCGCAGAAGETCEACAGGHVQVHRSVTTGGEPKEAAPAILQEVLSSPGRPIDNSTRAFMETRFKQDFSRVRIHNDSNAAAASEAFNARAFTLGQDVVFGTGQYRPESSEGKKLLAHELAHVVQQGGSRQIVQRAAPAVAVVAGAGGISMTAILGWIAFVGSAILAAYLLIQAYEAARRSGIGLDSAFQAVLAVLARILQGARNTVRAVNDLLTRASRLARRPPGCNDAIQQLSVLIVQFELVLEELTLEVRSAVPRLHVVRDLIQQLESLLPEIGMWIRIVMRECFP